MTVPAAGLLLTVFWALRLREADNVDAEPTKARVNTREAMRRYFNDPNLTIAYFIAVSRSVFYVSIFTYVPMYVVSAGLDEALGGYFISASTLVLFAGPFLSRFVPMIGVRRLIMCSFFFAAFCLIIAGNLTASQAYLVFGLLLASTVSASVSGYCRKSAVHAVGKARRAHGDERGLLHMAGSELCTDAACLADLSSRWAVSRPCLWFSAPCSA